MVTSCDCANVVPAKTIKLCDFLREAKIELFVKESGTGVWRATLTPPVELDKVFGLAEATGKGDTPEAAIQDLCWEMSGEELLGRKTGWFRRLTYNFRNVKVIV